MISFFKKIGTRIRLTLKTYRRRITNIIICLLLLILFGALFTVVYREAIPGHEKPKDATYDENAYYMDGQYLQYEDEKISSVKGIDVSAHQREIDWEAVKESGVEFAIIRVGYRGTTEGHLYADEYFEENYQAAKAVGLKVGSYFFSQATTVEEAEEEAIYACSILKKHDLDLPVFYDWEVVHNSTRTSTTEGIPLTECCMAFCDLVQRRGFDPGVYFNLSYAYDDLDMSRLDCYSLWLAEYNETPTYRGRYDFIQYSDEGDLPGIDVNVDLDLMMIPREK